MEALEIILSAIGSLGFPIVMCILMFDYMKKSSNQLNSSVASLTGVVNELKDLVKLMLANQSNIQ